MNVSPLRARRWAILIFMFRVPARVFVLFLLTFGVTTAPALAQAGGGLKAGIMSSEVSTDPDASSFLSRLNDITAGVFVVPTDNLITGQFEGMYSRRGVGIGGDIFGLIPGSPIGGGDLLKVRATYLDLSAFVRIQNGEPNTFYVFAGPTFGVKLKAEAIAPGLTEDIGDIVEDLDTAIAVGAGADLRHMIIEARYLHGLSDVLSGAGTFGVQIRHRAFAVVAGYRF